MNWAGLWLQFIFCLNRKPDHFWKTISKHKKNAHPIPVANKKKLTFFLRRKSLILCNSWLFQLCFRTRDYMEEMKKPTMKESNSKHKYRIHSLLLLCVCVCVSSWPSARWLGQLTDIPEQIPVSTLSLSLSLYLYVYIYMFSVDEFCNQSSRQQANKQRIQCWVWIVCCVHFAEPQATLHPLAGKRCSFKRKNNIDLLNLDCSRWYWKQHSIYPFFLPPSPEHIYSSMLFYVWNIFMCLHCTIPGHIMWNGMCINLRGSWVRVGMSAAAAMWLFCFLRTLVLHSLRVHTKHTSTHIAYWHIVLFWQTLSLLSKSEKKNITNEWQLRQSPPFLAFKLEESIIFL